MHWLTRIRVPVRETASLRLSDSYAWHKMLWRAFPGHDSEERGFLTRVDTHAGYAEALLLSPIEPVPQDWGEWDTKRIASTFLDHDRYRFSLRANPTVRRVVRTESGDRKKNGRRTGIFDGDGLTAWIEQKASAAGFRVETVSFDPPIRDHFLRNGKPGVHIRVDYRGVLVVTDRDAFKGSFAEGIGPAKGFGFGMLLLQPLE